MHGVFCYMVVASNKYDGDTFNNVRDKKNWCEEIGFRIVCLRYMRIKVYLSRKCHKRWK